MMRVILIKFNHIADLPHGLYLRTLLLHQAQKLVVVKLTAARHTGRIVLLCWPFVPLYHGQALHCTLRTKQICAQKKISQVSIKP